MEMIIANLSNSLTDLFSVGRAATTKMSQISQYPIFWFRISMNPSYAPASIIFDHAVIS